MSTLNEIVATLSANTGVRFRPADPADLVRLRSLGTPDSVVAFYAETVELLREIEFRAEAGGRGDTDWLKRHGKVYAALDAA